MLKPKRKVINHKRCNKIIISAMKQPIKYHLPKRRRTTFKQFTKKEEKAKKIVMVSFIFKGEKVI